MKILILSGKFGMGHNSAAQAIEEELKIIDRTIEVDRVDLLAYIYPASHEFIYKGFNRVVDKHHGLYNMIYRASEKLEMDMKLSSTSINRKMGLLLEIYRPDMIISTLPLCARTISAYKEASGIDLPLITCVTDISIHREWIADNTDYYLVPTREIKENLMRNRVDERRVFVVGIPVKQDFKNLEKLEKTSGKKNILIMGGGLGLLPELDDLMEEVEKVDSIRTTIITGRNKKAYQELKGTYRNTEVLGFTDRVRDHMKGADIMVSKAGGISLFESIYSQTPLFVIRPFLAQEIANARFIEEKGLGRVVWDRKADFRSDLLDLVYNDLEIRSMENNMAALRRDLIEEDIARVLEGLCQVWAA